MQKKIVLPNKKDLKFYEKYGINTFLLPLEEYSVGCDVYFNIDEINTYSNDYEIYVLMNKFLHKDIDNFDINMFNKNIKFIVEDIGLVNKIDSDRLVLYENHILSNYKAINYLRDLSIFNVVVNNDLTIKELESIDKNTSSNLYYFYVSKNMLMYSRRPLVSAYKKHYDIKNDKNEYLLNEKVTHKTLDIKEEKYSSVVRYNKIFCASLYLDRLKNYNLIYDFSRIDEINEKMILENMDNDGLCYLIDCDYYFLENDIKYKVGDLQ